MIFLPSTSRDSKLKIITKALKWGVGVGGAFEMGCFFFSGMDRNDGKNP